MFVVKISPPVTGVHLLHETDSIWIDEGDFHEVPMGMSEVRQLDLAAPLIAPVKGCSAG